MLIFLLNSRLVEIFKSFYKKRIIFIVFLTRFHSCHVVFFLFSGRLKQHEEIERKYPDFQLPFYGTINSRYSYNAQTMTLYLHIRKLLSKYGMILLCNFPN